MRILVLNAGSSSQKSCLYHLPNPLSGLLTHHPPNPLWEAQIDWIPHQQSASLKVTTQTGNKHSETVSVSTREKTLSYLLSLLYQGPTKVVDSLEEIDGVGHRVVHGGQIYQASVLITPDVKAAIDRPSVLAPNHNPANLEGIELMERLLPKVPQVAVFDTAFHSHLPATAATYPGPYAWLAQGIRRYGFHGISYQYCTQRAAQLLTQPIENLRLIICHLGNGASLAAVKNGHSIDTTMGFTPLEGLMMGTRSGSVDPGILIHLMRQGQSAEEIDQALNQASGLKGISGISHDLREIEKGIAAGNSRAQLAQDIYIHRIKSGIGSMLMSLGGLDALVFTAGVGEHAAGIRAAVCEGMGFLGLRLDAAKNEQHPVDTDIATEDSSVRVLVIHTQEDYAIAQACWHQITRGS